MAGYTVLRIVLGINVVMHGIARLLAGSGMFAGHLSKQFGATMLPASLVTAFGYSLPWVEAALGTLILFGIFTRLTLVAGGLLIAVLSYGSGLIQDWNALGTQLLYAAVYALLLAFCHYNTISLDTLLERCRQHGGNRRS